MSKSIGLHSIAVKVPDRVLTNDYWRRQHPELVAQAEERISAIAQSGWQEAAAPSREMAPYFKDPFQGSKERRVLAEGGTALELEAQAAREAMAIAQLDTTDIDLLICTSAQPDHYGIGSATFLARELELRGAAWNIESEGASALIALQTACSLIETGQFRRALVVTSCTYSRLAPETQIESWGLGDAATAMVVGPVADSLGYRTGHSVHTGDSRAAMDYQLEDGKHQTLRYRLRKNRQAASALQATAEQHLVACARQALDKAKLTFADIDHFVFNTPFAWSAAFFAKTLGIDTAQTSNIYPFYADAGPALLGLNLFHASHWKNLQPSERVLLCSVDTASSCTSAVLCWGDVALGAAPDGTSLDRLHSLEAEALAHYRLQRLDREVLEPTQSTRHADQRLRRIVAGYTDLAIDEPGIMRLFVDHTAEEKPPLTEEIREHARRFVDALEDSVAQVFRQRSRDASVDPAVAAMSLLGIVHWGVCSYREEGRISRDEAIEQVTQLALHGLIAQPTTPSSTPLRSAKSY